MNRVIWNRCSAWCVVLVLLGAGTASAQGPRLQLDNLSRLSTLASQSTDITLDPAMLQLAGNFLSAANPDTAAIKKLISGLTSVNVKSFQFDREGAYTIADIDAVRRQLKAGWTRLVATESKAAEQLKEMVEIYAFREGDRSTGLAIVVAEPRELTVVNIVGPIDLSQLAALQGQFGIPNLNPPPGSAGPPQSPK